MTLALNKIDSGESQFNVLLNGGWKGGRGKVTNTVSTNNSH